MTGIPPPPTADGDDAFSQHTLMELSSTISLGSGEAHHAAPSAAGVLDDDPSHLVCPAPRFRFVHEATDRLGGIAEGRVVLIYQICVTMVATFLLILALIEDVLEVLLQGIADCALAVGAAYLQRYLVHPLHRAAISERRRMNPTCGPLPCGQRHIPARLDHVCDVITRFFRRLILIFDAYMLRIFDQRVAADSDHRKRSCGSLLNLLLLIIPSSTP